MNILIIADYFSPQRSIAAVRPTKLYKYWKRQGHKVLVLTTTKSMFSLDPNNPIDTIIEDDIISIDCKVWYEALMQNQKSKYYASINLDNNSNENSIGKPSQVNKLIKSAKRVAVFIYRKNYLRKWLKKSKKYIKLNSFVPDVIFSTFNPVHSHYIGRYAKKRYPSAKWIADFRDFPEFIHSVNPAERMGNPKTFARRICKTADAINAVADGYLKKLYLPDSFKTSAITNGFDYDNKIEILDIVNEKLTFVMTGHIYERQRFDKLFCALRGLVDEEKVKLNEIKFQYAGGCGQDLINQARAYNVEDIIQDCGVVKRIEAIEMQQKADALVMGSWNLSDGSMLIPGKFFEYMISDRPVVATVTGDVPNSEFYQRFNECNLGMCYEEAQDNYYELKEFILDLYNKWKAGERIVNKQNKNEVEMYSYSVIAQRLLQLVE